MCILIALVIYPVCFAAELNLGKSNKHTDNYNILHELAEIRGF